MATTTAGTTLTIPQAVQMARTAGFTDQSSLITFVAILEGESSLNTHAINSSDPNGGSFGIAQINGVHFGQQFRDHTGATRTMSESVAFDPQLAMDYSYQLSGGGKNFRPWGAFTDGRYYQFIDAVRQVVLNSGSSGQSPFPPYTGEPWYDFDVYTDKGWQGSTYWNTDVRTPLDTPITASLPGKVTDLGYFDWGGQVTVKVDDPSQNHGYKDYFVIHLDAINPELHVGTHVKAGTLLGWSGGENSTSDPRLKPLPAGLKHHVTTPAHSSGPHLDIGVTNSDTGSLVDSTAAGKQASDALVFAARSGEIPFGTGDPFGTGGVGPQDNSTTPPPFPITSFVPLPEKVHNTLVQNPGFYGIAAAIDEANQFPGFINEIQGPNDVLDAQGWTEIPGSVLQSVADTVIGNTIPLVIRGTLILAGLLLVMALLWQLTKPNIEALSSLALMAA